MRLLAPELTPKLVTVLREGYSKSHFAGDLLAGVVVGVVALPLAIAFAIASGARPEQGLYTAIIAGFLISVFGGSRVQIGGPTGAFVVIVSGIIARFGYDGLAVATLMAGGFLVIFAVMRLGDMIRFIPYPVTVGFTTGIALLIATGQVGDALGLQITSLPPGMVDRFDLYIERLPTLRPAAVAVFLATVVIVQIWSRLRTRVPGPLVALVVTTVVARVAELPVDTINSRFGDVPGTLPVPRLPQFDPAILSDLVSPAIAIALLAAIESLLSAVVADGLTGGRHRSNAELLAQGVANLASPIFGGIPATGAIARTATNIRNGGRSPVAGVVHATTLMVILVAAGPWAGLIPMATLAGILMVVAYNMSEWHVFVRLLRAPRSDVIVLMTTFVLTVAVDLVVAIQVGMVLAALLFMRRMAEVTQVKQLRDLTDYEAFETTAEGGPDVPPGVEVFEIHGSFCFGAARKFTETLLSTTSAPEVVILRMKHVIAMDATGLHALEDVMARLGKRGTRLVLSGVHAQPLMVLVKGGLVERIGEDRVCGDFATALGRAKELVESSRE